MKEQGKEHPKERRKSRRVVTTLEGTLAGPGAEPIEVTTLNLSAGGVYATTPRYFSPYTKIQLAVEMPPLGEGEADGEPEARAESGEASGPSRGKKGREGEARARIGGGDEAGTLIQVEGIVVRCEPLRETPGTFSVAIAFLHLPPAVRNRIEAYVTWRLERSLIESAGSLGGGG